MSIISRKQNFNPFYDINDLPFNNNQKEMILEYLARKFWMILIEVRDWDNSGKCYDPLVIDSKHSECYSYMFNLKGEGRTHKINSLIELENLLVDEIISALQEK